MSRPAAIPASVAVFMLLALEACSPKGGEAQTAAHASASGPVTVSVVYEEERKCTDEPRTDESDKRPHCEGGAKPAAPRAYRVVGGSGDPVDDVVCDIGDAFVLNGRLFGVEFSGGVDGTWKFVRTPNIPGLGWKAGGHYHIEFPDGAGKPGTMTTAGGGTTTAGITSRETTGGEKFTLAPTESCKETP